ncbi:hypothetical protein BGX26_009775 [Mortierella sp. AD094]|nr:hypothetical protein BGX26_009775 [Mortierella sp. AD094]
MECLTPVDSLLGDIRAYSLDPDQKGQYYISKGDQYRDKGNFKKVAKNYDKASKHCPDQARERMNELPCQTLSLGNKASSAQSSSAPETIIGNAKGQISKTLGLNSQQPTLKGPYFPRIASPPETALVLLPSPASQSPVNISSTIHEAPNTLFLANSFVDANTKNNESEKAAIRGWINKVIRQFDRKSISLESMQELAVLATIPDKEIFLEIIDQILKVQIDSPILPTLAIHGVAVILSSFPEEIDFKNMHGAFLDILAPLKNRLETIGTKHNEDQLLPLLRALSALFDAMLFREVSGLDRVNIHNPLHDLLGALESHDDTAVSFLAQYAKQALAYIGNDESLKKSIFRRGKLAIAIVMDVNKAVTNSSLAGFQSAYENFTKMCDFSIKSAWYQGLIYVDCLLGNQDLERFEKFVIESDLKTDECFLQGICLRLEQITITHTDEEICNGAIGFLQDLGASSTGKVQQASQSALQRLGVNRKAESSIATSQSTFGLSMYSLPLTSQVDLRPVWDPFWRSTPNSILLKAVQDEERGHQNMSRMHTQFNNVRTEIQTSTISVLKHVNVIQSDIAAVSAKLPKSCSMNQVSNALYAYYKPHIVIQRVSGKELNPGSCFINLAIMEAVGQHNKDEYEARDQALSIRHVQCHKGEDIQALIPLESLFDKRKLRNEKEGIPKRIMIYGDAGIGKTTLCKKMVHMFHTGLWKGQFDTMLWIPLRQLRAFKARDLEGLLREKYFAHQLDMEKAALARELARCARDGRILFILDGLDEVVSDSQTDGDIALVDFVKHLLQQDHVIITSRPSGVDVTLLENLDLELMAVGLNTQNVEDYVNRILEPVGARFIQDFIKMEPSVRELVNIPAQLDLVCYSWESFPWNAFLMMLFTKYFMKAERNCSISGTVADILERYIKEGARCSPEK